MLLVSSHWCTCFMWILFFFGFFLLTDRPTLLKIKSERQLLKQVWPWGSEKKVQGYEVLGFVNQHSPETGESLNKIAIVIVPDPSFSSKRKKSSLGGYYSVDWTHIFGFYTFLVGLIDSHWLQVPSESLLPIKKYWNKQLTILCSAALTHCVSLYTNLIKGATIKNQSQHERM